MRPSGHPDVNATWMWDALVAVNLSAWLHELAGLEKGPRPRPSPPHRLRRELICLPARLVRHARRWTLRLPHRPQVLPELFARLRAL